MKAPGHVPSVPSPKSGTGCVSVVIKMLPLFNFTISCNDRKRHDVRVH